MIFRKLLNNSIPKPILHYDFSEIADNKCPNKGSLGSDYDLEIEGDSVRPPFKSKGYPLSLWYLSSYTTENTENIWSFSWDLLYPGGSPTSGEFGFEVLVQSEISFGLYVENINFKTGMWQLVSGHPTGDSSVEIGPQMPLVAGWNIITLNTTGVSDPYLRIITESNTDTNFGGTILTLKQTPIFNNCFVTGNNVYGKLTDGVSFVFNKDSGFSTVAVRELQQTATNIVWHKDKTDSLDHIAWEKYTNSKFTNDIFGESNVITAPEGTISYGTSKNYNGTAVIRGENLDDDTQVFRVGGDVDGSATFTTQRELLIWNQDLTDSQLQEYISKNIIPIPEVYYDVDKQQALNTDESKGHLIDYSGHGHHGELKNFTYSNPEWTQPNWRIINTNDSEQIPRVTAEELSTGVYHITELVREYSTGFLGGRTTNVAGKKFCINVLNKPADRELGVTFEGIAVTNLQEGNNIIDLSNSKHTGIDGWDYIWISGDPGTVDFYITIFPFFDETSANGWGYQQLPDLDSWVELNTSIISKNKVKLTGTNGNYDSLNYSILPIYHDNNIAVFSPFKARFKVETTRESGQIGFAADGHVQASGSQVVQGAYISYIDNGYVNVDFPGYIWDVSNLEMTTDPYLYCYPGLGNNAVIEQLPIQDYLTMNGDLNNQIDINSEDTYQTILVDMGVSEDGESELNNYNNNLTNYINFSPLYRTSKLYKYLAFKENLTDDQIQLAIDKYGFKYPLQLVFNNDFNNDFKWN